MKKRYSVTEDQCNCKLAEFFDNIAKLSGETGDISNLKYDCRKFVLQNRYMSIFEVLFRCW